jgi:L-aspartate semialdehyde sulfurtransferase ferredoxin
VIGIKTQGSKIMLAIGRYQAQKTKPSLMANHSQQSSVTQIRLQLQITQYYPLKAIISNLISEQGLTVNVTGVRIEKNAHQHLDLEIQGTILQINNGLNYLQSLDLKIRGKPNTEGDK